MRSCALFLTVTIAGLGSASAQSLADVARKETERRQTVKDVGKIFTNDDLKPVPATGSESAAQTAADGAPTDGGAANAPSDTQPADGAETAPSSTSDPNDQKSETVENDKKDGKDEEHDGVKDQQYWSKRMASLRDKLGRDETFLDALQSRVSALNSDFVNRDDPAQRAQIAADRDRALAELDRLRKEVEADKRAIPELEEDARRVGVPAGWLR